jgi:hypothetical protein
LQQRIRPWLPTKSKLQSRSERFGEAHPKSRDIASVLDCERGKKKKTLCAWVVGLLHHRCITLIENPNSSSSLQLNSSHIKVIRKVTFSFIPYPLFQWYPQSKEILLNFSTKC